MEINSSWVGLIFPVAVCTDIQFSFFILLYKRLHITQPQQSSTPYPSSTTWHSGRKKNLPSPPNIMLSTTRSFTSTSCRFPFVFILIKRFGKWWDFPYEYINTYYTYTHAYHTRCIATRTYSRVRPRKSHIDTALVCGWMINKAHFCVRIIISRHISLFRRE